jgi:hypothetical protein
MVEGMNVAHALLHINPSSSYRKAQVNFATSEALATVYDQNNVNDRRKMFSLLESTKNRPLFASSYGRIFEDYALEKLEEGGVFKIRRLHNGYSGPEEPLTIKKSKRKWVEELKVDMKADQLYQPVSKNYANIDAWMPETGAFQITASSAHIITDRSTLKKDLEKLRAKKLFWVLPSYMYDSDLFKKKNPEEIDQYVLRVPLPAEVEKLLRREDSDQTGTEASNAKAVHPREGDVSPVETERVKKKRKL